MTACWQYTCVIKTGATREPRLTTLYTYGATREDARVNFEAFGVIVGEHAADISPAPEIQTTLFEGSRLSRA
jgi:hypothetical protein